VINVCTTNSLWFHLFWVLQQSDRLKQENEGEDTHTHTHTVMTESTGT